MSDSDALERIETKLDVALLVMQGVPRAEAEARVYVPKLVKLTEELRAAVQRLDDVVEGYGR